MRIGNFHSSQITEGGLQAITQLALHLLLESFRERRMVGHAHDDLQLVGRILFRIELSGSFTTKTQSAQRRIEKSVSEQMRARHDDLSFMSLKSLVSFVSLR